MKMFSSILVSLLVLGCATLFIGCETEPAGENDVSITPSSARIRLNQSIEFTASGGYDYTWDIENESWGVLSTRSGNKTVYTSRYNPNTNVGAQVQVLTVRSTIAASTSSTNADSSYEMTSEAHIEHISGSGAATAVGGGPLSIEPRVVAVGSGGRANFTASGGTGSYSWTCGSPAGSAFSYGGNSATYIAPSYGTNAAPASTWVKVASGAETAQATVTHN